MYPGRLPARLDAGLWRRQHTVIGTAADVAHILQTYAYPVARDAAKVRVLARCPRRSLHTHIQTHNESCPLQAHTFNCFARAQAGGQVGRVVLWELWLALWRSWTTSAVWREQVAKAIWKDVNDGVDRVVSTAAERLSRVARLERLLEGTDASAARDERYF